MNVDQYKFHFSTIICIEINKGVLLFLTDCIVAGIKLQPHSINSSTIRFHLRDFDWSLKAGKFSPETTSMVNCYKLTRVLPELQIFRARMPHKLGESLVASVIKLRHFGLKLDAINSQLQTADRTINGSQTMIF